MVRIGSWVALLSALWCLAGGALLIFDGVPGSESPAWRSVLASGVVIGSIGFIVAGVVAVVAEDREKQRRWRADLYHGTATLTDLRPGDVNGDHGTQDLLCHLEVTASGRRPTAGEFKTAVGPLDALKVVEGASFPCEASPSFPDRVRVQITAERHLEFRRRDAKP